MNTQQWSNGGTKQLQPRSNEVGRQNAVTKQNEATVSENGPAKNAAKSQQPHSNNAEHHQQSEEEQPQHNINMAGESNRRHNTNEEGIAHNNTAAESNLQNRTAERQNVVSGGRDAQINTPQHEQNKNSSNTSNVNAGNLSKSAPQPARKEPAAEGTPVRDTSLDKQNGEHSADPGGYNGKEEGLQNTGNTRAPIAQWEAKWIERVKPMKQSTVGVTSETHQGSEEEVSNTRDKARNEKLEKMADEILDKAATVLIEKAYDEVFGDESTSPQRKSWGRQGSRGR